MPSPTLSQFEHEIGARIGRGDLRGAGEVAERCRAAWPSHPAGWLLGSIAALLTDEKEEALALVTERLAIDPRNVQCLLQRAECLLALGDRPGCLSAADDAAAAAVSATANRDEMRVSLDALGEFLYHAGEYRRATAVYGDALTVAPRDPTLYAKRADLHRVLGNFDAAISDYEAALAIAPGTPKALKGLTELRHQSTDRNAIATLETALAAAPPDSTDAAILHFALAKSYDDLADYAASWRHLSAGNRIERARIDYAPGQDRAFIDRLIEEFPGPEPVAPDSTGARPIFIVGIPRTGTTLVERIIGSHSQVHSAGEISALSDAIDAAARHGTRSLGQLNGKVIAEEYLARCRALRTERPRFTDKLLTNFFHCALILRAFPNARIVHVVRQPLAACYAIYRTRFNGNYPFAYDLGEIGEFYVGYRRLMAHWHRVLPGRILDVAYEDVVTALEPSTRRMLDYLDLPFEAGCLDFQKNPAPVNTTSSVQVRQALYDSSLHAWQAYASELNPFRRRLEAAGVLIP